MLRDVIRETQISRRKTRPNLRNVTRRDTYNTIFVHGAEINTQKRQFPRNSRRKTRPHTHTHTSRQRLHRFKEPTSGIRTIKFAQICYPFETIIVSEKSGYQISKTTLQEVTTTMISKIDKRRPKDQRITDAYALFLNSLLKSFTTTNPMAALEGVNKCTKILRSNLKKRIFFLLVSNLKSDQFSRLVSKLKADQQNVKK